MRVKPPFVQVPKWVWTAEGLTVPERWVLATLFMLDGPKGLFPSLKTLSRHAGLTKEGLSRILGRLEKKGFLVIERQKGKPNRYLIPDQQGIDPRSTPHCSRINTVLIEDQPINTKYKDYLHTLSINTAEMVKKLGEQLGVKEEYVPKDEAFYEKRKEEIRRQLRELTRTSS